MTWKVQKAEINCTIKKIYLDLYGRCPCVSAVCICVCSYTSVCRANSYPQKKKTQHEMNKIKSRNSISFGLLRAFLATFETQ